MPRPGFYNDNEYRSYPLVFAAPATGLPDSAIVDAGVIMRIDAYFNDRVNTVWLSKITRAANKFYFEFKTDVSATTLVFTRDTTADEWQTEYVDSATVAGICAENDDPVWEGFLVTGPLADLNTILPVDGVLSFLPNKCQLEPGRIQNLNKAYVRSISIGNYERPVVPACDPDGQTTGVVTPKIILNKACMQGDLRLKAGYNCVIRQPTFANELIIGAVRGGGAEVLEGELCAAGSELALFPGEPLFANSKFYSGGPACDDLIFTLNGIGGAGVTITGGDGVNIATQTDPPKITIARNLTAGGGCAGAPS